ncbi:MAG: DUF2029 domain-containing protein [Roseiflexaceae bacterium]
MAEAITPAPPGRHSDLNLLGRVIVWSLAAALGLLIVAQLVFFAIHAAHMLGYRYPLDYGEGPLLAQVDLLRAGMPVWQLYSDPNRAPYAVVNYPPAYHLATLLLALPLGDALLAGRLVSLTAALAAVGALAVLTKDEGRTPNPPPPLSFVLRPSSSVVLRLLLILAFLALPIVREWSVVMRVDMLGVCLGLWGLVIVQRQRGRAWLWATLPLALSLLVKPSLIAAPSAALLWLLFRDWRRALLLGGLLALLGGLAVAVLQLGSGGWFLVHVLAANANTWQRQLAYGFWHDQMLILWPLVVAAALSIVWQLFYREPPRGYPTENRKLLDTVLDSRSSVLLALYYTLFGAIVALGVGKVGAYANYFLEFYAGLIWLVAAVAKDEGRRTKDGIRSSFVLRLSFFVRSIVALLVSAALLRYYPIWSENYLKLAGIIEGRNPPRLIAGGYGVWQDLRRERAILATLSGVNAALVSQVQAADAPIFTDVPGVAAQADQLARLQVFEYRQLLAAGIADQRSLLHDLANGRVPLVVLDYLGNWLTPEMIAMITHRYAQDGSLGTYDLYRPVDPGPAVALDLAFPNGLRLTSYHLVPSLGRPAYHGGETVLLTLDWRQEPEAKSQAPGAESIELVVQLTDAQGHILQESRRPLLYGALPPASWGDTTVQHMQPLALPAEILPGTYTLALTLRAGERDLAPPQTLAPLTIEPTAGRQLGENGFYVPAPLLDAWAQLGGDEGPGDALMPATPFQNYTLQCFTRACLRLADGEVQQLALGELVHLADVGSTAALPSQTIDSDFLDYWREHGGVERLGPPITGAFILGDRIVQYTRYARLERPRNGGRVRLGRLGEEFLRLPGGVPYRWP